MSESLVSRPFTWLFVVVAVVMAFVMPLSYLGSFLDLDGHTKDLPIAIASEDAGADINGRNVNLGQQVVASITGPNPQLGHKVKWLVLPNRPAVLAKIGDDKAYAVIVVPRDYSLRVAALSNPAVPPNAPAAIEILTNPAAGSYASTVAQQIATTAVSQVAQSVRQQVSRALTAAHATVPPALAPLVAAPVQPQITVAAPAPPHSASGMGPFYFAVMLTLAGLIGADIVNVGVDFLAGIGELGRLIARIRGAPIAATPVTLWGTKLIATVVMSILAGIVQTLVAVGMFSMPHDANLWRLTLFAILCVAATALLTLLLLTAFGTAGLLLAVLFTTLFGVASSGGPYPLQMLPDFFRFLASWLPLRFETDGMRALVFFGGRAAAGLRSALWVLGAYAIASVVLGGIVAWVFDRTARERARASRAVAGAPRSLNG